MWERIRRRGRPEESGLDPDFVSRLQRCHDDWLVHRNLTTGFEPPAERVLVLDGNLPREEFLRMVRSRQDEILGRKKQQQQQGQ